MRAAGLVEQTPDPADGRARVLALTARGDAMVTAAIAIGTAYEAALAERLGPRQARALRRGLEGIVAQAGRRASSRPAASAASEATRYGGRRAHRLAAAVRDRDRLRARAARAAGRPQPRVRLAAGRRRPAGRVAGADRFCGTRLGRDRRRGGARDRRRRGALRRRRGAARGARARPDRDAVAVHRVRRLRWHGAGARRRARFGADRARAGARRHRRDHRERPDRGPRGRRRGHRRRGRCGAAGEGRGRRVGRDRRGAPARRRRARVARPSVRGGHWVRRWWSWRVAESCSAVPASRRSGRPGTTCARQSRRS